MKTILFNFEHSPVLASEIAQACGFARGEFELRRFPDGESYVRIKTAVQDTKVIILAALDRPDPKLMSLLLIARTLRSLGATEVGLIVPYLPYMRQDAIFQSGEGITAQYFAELISSYFTWLLTLDPHLHRIKNLHNIYSIPTTVLHVVQPIQQWIQAHVKKPLLIGPDNESVQWVKAIADLLAAPFVILTKERLGDREVKISLPDVSQYHSYTPILLDDIISSAHTMAEAVKVVHKVGLSAPICIGIHGIFAENGYEILSATQPQQIVTCNTVLHPSNAIDVSGLVIDALK